MDDLTIEQKKWRTALQALPRSTSSTPDKIPAFFFGHGSPTLLMEPSDLGPRFSNMRELTGLSSRLAKFLSDFGPTLLDKYHPRAILVFSAHWETEDQILVSDYGDNQPLLMDYYGFNQEMYQVTFHSNGASQISQRVVDVLSKAGITARTTQRSEARGMDGRGFHGPGLDHGVFVPFKLMFGDLFTEVPIIQASIYGDLDPNSNLMLGKVVSQLRSEGVLILAGGLTIHNLSDPKCWSEATAGPELSKFHESIYEALEESDPMTRKEKMLQLISHPGFRQAHPRSEHFVPIYIAAGAGEQGKVEILNRQYAAPTIAFGL